MDCVTNLLSVLGRVSLFSKRWNALFTCLTSRFPPLTGGDIYIWDRETAILLHSIQNPSSGDESGDLTALGWNHNCPGKFMFASATYDGTVRIWTAPAPPDTEPPSRAESPSPLGLRGRGMSGFSRGIERIGSF